jgi:hypothetical protein
VFNSLIKKKKKIIDNFRSPPCLPVSELSSKKKERKETITLFYVLKKEMTVLPKRKKRELIKILLRLI